MSRVHVMNCYRTSNRPSIINIKVIGNYFLNIKRVSFGYRNYDNLRNRIIITSRLFASTTKRD